jgi:hypothetical protein
MSRHENFDFLLRCPCSSRCADVSSAIRPRPEPNRRHRHRRTNSPEWRGRGQLNWQLASELKQQRHQCHRHCFDPERWHDQTTGTGRGIRGNTGGLTLTVTNNAGAVVSFFGASTYTGTTISGGATVTIDGKIANRLPVGATFILISNTAATPIAGTVANLPDGTILTIEGNHLQASYESGDGNDLTLTVVP